MRRHYGGAYGPADNVFFRTKKTQSGEYLQLVKIEGAGWGRGPRRQVVLHSFGSLHRVDFVRLKGTLDRIALTQGVPL